MNPVKIKYTCKAEDDLTSIFEYIGENSPENALKYIAKMREVIENLATSPHIGIHCRSKGIDRECRILIFEKYMIFYQFDEADNAVRILRILHGSRKYQNLLVS